MLRKAYMYIMEIMLGDDNDLEDEKEGVEKYHPNWRKVDLTDFLHPQMKEGGGSSGNESTQSFQEIAKACRLPKLELQQYYRSCLGWLGWQLLDLVIEYTKRKTLYLEDLYDRIESHLRSLEASSERNAAFLYPLVESRMLEELLKSQMISKFTKLRIKSEIIATTMPERKLWHRRALEENLSRGFEVQCSSKEALSRKFEQQSASLREVSQQLEPLNTRILGVGSYNGLSIWLGPFLTKYHQLQGKISNLRWHRSSTTFRPQFEVIARVNRWSDIEMAVALHGPVAEILETIPVEQQLVYGGLVDSLSGKYGMENYQQLHAVRFRTNIKTEGNPLQEVSNDLQRL
ncbi:hypothetical protein LAZ67_2006016 [Cordylochernes scorpioides]|uniref:Uncharacterized protein n=1 Tax=Cordylochernes scorpioides TaxID=51811 RepID=A0ABY6K4Y0_9ARAC|nr:hypothetical protein LAZ67_2006016 [Cordylochernes scorpioides]